MLVTDVEAFQEILHRYASIRRFDAIQPVFDALFGIVEAVFSIHTDDVLAAKDVLATHQMLQARDALHVAVMRREGVTRILTYDRAFDAVRGIERISA